MVKQYNITGMSCAACSSRVEKAVSALENVDFCNVNLLTNSMSVDGNASEDTIIEAVKNAGYGASVKGKAEKHPPKGEPEIKVIKNRLVFSIVVLLGLMYISMGHTMFQFPLPAVLAQSDATIALLQMVLSACVMIANQKFFINGFKGIVNRAPNMDTLVSLGSFSAFIYSLVLLFDMTITGVSHLHGLYFESAAMILTLITVGKMLEAKAKGKTTNALKGLMELAPQKATVIRNGMEVVVKAEDVVVGDIFVLRPGESVPVDGIVIDGISTVDESALTGESIPVDKIAGESVSAATINLSGYLKCQAKRVGKDTALAQIIEVVNAASATKAPIAKIADRVSGIFVPTVIIIALITLITWVLIGKDFGFSLARAISVLVISCPCALGLATPVAIMVGSGVGARHGILFKTAEALELTGKADIVALDKTGTITEGKPRVTDILPCEDISKEELLRVAASLEKNSEHPLSKAILVYADENDISTDDVTDFEVIPGSGLTAVLNDKNIFGGNLQFVKDKAFVDKSIELQAEKLASSGKTPLYFCENEKLLGIIAVADTIKEDSALAINELLNMGIRVAMISGDNEKIATAIGKLANISEVYGDVRPDEKEKIIQKLKKDGRVIMVGDGINDAPALTSADIGIAVAAGTDIAIDAADVVVMKSTLSDVVYSIKLSKKVIRNIHQNLFWAFGYNIIGIPLAAGLFSALGFTMNPMFGAAAMSVSSVLVVTNALRLNLVKLNNKKESKEKTQMEKVIKIEGMMCPHCEARVKTVLEGMPNVESADVSHKDGTAKLVMTGDISNETLKKTIEEQGYTVISIEE